MRFRLAMALGATGYDSCVLGPSSACNDAGGGMGGAGGSSFFGGRRCLAVSGDRPGVGVGGRHGTGSAANGSPIDTSPGTHTFTVQGRANNGGGGPISTSVTYTVTAGGGGSGAPTTKARGDAAGRHFELTVPAECIAPAAPCGPSCSDRLEQVIPTGHLHLLHRPWHRPP